MSARLIQWFFLLVLVWPGMVGFCQKGEWTLGAGINLGGPVPVQFEPGTSGMPLPAGHLGGIFQWPLSEKFSLSLGLSWDQLRTRYESSFTRDTLYTFTSGGVTNTVPTWYTAMVRGKMNLHFPGFTLEGCYKSPRQNQFRAGLYVATFLAGADQGTVRVQIGEGGFFDDYLEDFDNTAIIRKADAGLTLGFDQPLGGRIRWSVALKRSFRTLYIRDPSEKDQSETRLVPTLFRVGLLWRVL